LLCPEYWHILCENTSVIGALYSPLDAPQAGRSGTPPLRKIHTCVGGARLARFQGGGCAPSSAMLVIGSRYDWTLLLHSLLESYTCMFGDWVSQGRTRSCLVNLAQSGQCSRPAGTKRCDPLMITVFNCVNFRFKNWEGRYLQTRPLDHLSHYCIYVRSLSSSEPADAPFQA
jgi:hypothetical protein